jgi:photosystem II stability/assembly factor-like uncharacterized protein
MRILPKKNLLISNTTWKLIILLILGSNISFSQVINNPIPNINGIDNSSSFFEIRDAMNKYWNDQNVNNNELTKVNGIERKVPDWKRFKRWEYFWEQRVDPVTGAFPQTNSIIEYNKYKDINHSLKKTDDYTSSWSNLGTNSSSGGYAGIGRINCIAFHPTDINTFWTGSPSGGIWKTTNGGSSWTILNNNEAVIGVSAIAISSDYSTSNTLYIATGDRDGGSMWSLSGGQSADNVSNGVYKSTDGGATWNATGLTFLTSEGYKITSLKIHPSNNLILFASTWNGNSTNSGMWKSTDAGATWSKKTSNLWMDIEFKPGDPNIMYASSYGYGSTYINKSTDNGESWSMLSVASSGRRGEIAVTPADPNVVYLLSANSSGGVYSVYKSTDSGVNFAAVNAGSPAGMLGYYTDGSGGSGGQGSYDWCIAVDPTNANTVFIGGITTWKSTDGGTNFTANTCWTSSSFYNFSGVPEVHADKHVLAYQNSSTLFEGNDGGIYKTTNGGTSWTDLSDGMVISQIYRLGVSQTNINKVITGLQDNGSKLYNTGFWSDVTGGDGMECIIDYSNANYMYATYVRGEIYRSTNSGLSFSTTISENIPGGQPIGAWVTPYIIDQNNSATLFAGYDRVWKTTDRGNNWTSASQVLSSSVKLRSLAIAPSNSNILYAADQTSMWKTTDGGATNWSTITLPTTSSSVTYIAVKNNDPNTVWITYGGYNDGLKVYESTNGGTTWTNISAGLPNLPVMCITHYKTITERNVLFVGTDIGVYIKDGSSNWVSFSSGLPNVVVTELDINYGTTDKLRAATFGRGLWETEITGTVPVELISFTATTLGNAVKLNWKTETEINNYGFEIERKILKHVQNDSWEKIGFVNGSGNSNSPKDYSFVDDKVSNGKYSYRLKQIDNDGKYEYSNVIEADYEAITKYELSQNYPNPFNPTTKISWQSPVNSHQTLRVYDVLGNELATLVNEYREAGIYEINFDASNLPSGVYIYKLQVGEFIATRKMTLVK